MPPEGDLGRVCLSFLLGGFLGGYIGGYIGWHTVKHIKWTLDIAHLLFFIITGALVGAFVGLFYSTVLWHYSFIPTHAGLLMGYLIGIMIIKRRTRS